MTAISKVCAVCGETFEKSQTTSRRAWAKRQTCSRACGHVIKRGRPNPKVAAALRGRKADPEAVAKRAEGLKRAHAAGRAHVIDNTGLRREQTSQWKGDDIAYRAAHSRLTRERGKAEICELCGTRIGWLEWALRDDAEMIKIQAGGTGDGMRYSPRPTDYFQACRTCHRQYDRRAREARASATEPQ